MPCYNGSYDDETERPSFEERLSAQQRREIHKLKGALCALITELRAREIGAEIIDSAGKNGNFDFSEFWETHRNEDEHRLSDELKKFSKHEISIIKRLLKKA